MAKNSIEVEIGINLPHSKSTLEYIKENNFGLYLTLMSLRGKVDVVFSDVMILDYEGYYYCRICKDNRLYSAAFGNAQRHFESHFSVEEEQSYDEYQEHIF